MTGVEGEDVAAGAPAAPKSMIAPFTGFLLMLVLGIFLVAVLVFPGESHEGDSGLALQTWIPILANSLLAGAAFAVAGYLLALRFRPAALATGASPSPGVDFRTRFAAAPGGMALLDGDRILAANPALEAWVGARAGGLAGQDLAILLAETAEMAETAETSEVAMPEEGAGRLLARKADAVVPAFETLLRRRDGSTLVVEANAYPVAWEGQALHLLEVRDIQVRKGREDSLRKSEETLRRSEGALRALLAQSPVAFLAFDRAGRFTVAEGSALEAMGLPGNDLEGQDAFARIARSPNPARLRPLQEGLRRALDGHGAVETVAMGGGIFEVRLQPRIGEGGKADGAAGIALDVTDLRRVEEDLRLSKEHLRTVISNAPLILFALDGKGTYTLCEGRGLEALGINPGGHIGKSAFDLHREAPQLALNVRRALSGEEFTSTVEIRSSWFETYYSPVFEGYDEVAGVIGVAINVTERKRAEDALRRSEQQLRHSRKMEAIGRVAGGVAHDFNNLLTAITGYTELLLAPPKPGDPRDQNQNQAQDRKSLEEIRKAAERAAVLTRQLLAFSRRQVLSPEVTNLNRAVSEMDGMLRRMLRQDIELVAALDPGLGEVLVDPGQLEQVIMNLVLNARDAMPQGGHLTLETANVELDGPAARAELFVVPGPYVMLSVSDTGSGMDEEVKSHLFEPFFTTKPEGAALGLGLSAVYGIVKQSGGTIVVDSEKGRGTTFKVYLPRADRAASARLGRAPESLHGEETVLLVEDEEAVRTLIREILTMHGYKVLEARSGGEAILASQRTPGPIHMLLTDVVMANMSGRELADHLRPLRPEMKILFISGYSEDAILSENGSIRGLSSGNPAAGRGDADFLAKPFTPKTLALKVREVLEVKAGVKRGQVQRV